MSSIRPTLGAKAFNCPHCAAFSHQVWHRLLTKNLQKEEEQHRAFVEAAARLPGSVRNPGAMLRSQETAAHAPALPKRELPYLSPTFGNPTVDSTVQGVMLSVCVSCLKIATWVGEQMVHPVVELAARPHPEMPRDAAKTFTEAATIAAVSPRSATALLRLAIEQICRETDVKPAKIDDMIAELVGKGLPAQVQMALDIVRVTGNEAVHPGQIDTDNAETAAQLFELVNLIVEEVIARPRRIQELYGQLPAGKLEAIDRRNAKARGE